MLDACLRRRRMVKCVGPWWIVGTSPCPACLPMKLPDRLDRNMSLHYTRAQTIFILLSLPPPREK